MVSQYTISSSSRICWYAPLTWATDFITLTWRFFLAIWDSRNVFIYGSPISYSEVSYRQALMKDVLSLHSALALIADPTTDSWCFIAPNILRAQPLLTLRQWLRRARARLHGPPSSPLLSP